MPRPARATPRPHGVNCKNSASDLPIYQDALGDEPSAVELGALNLGNDKGLSRGGSRAPLPEASAPASGMPRACPGSGMPRACPHTHQVRSLEPRRGGIG